MKPHEKVAINMLLLIPGIFLLLWGIVCFLGGPEGKIGSIEAFKIGGGFAGTGAFLLYLRSVILRKAKDKE